MSREGAPFHSALDRPFKGGRGSGGGDLGATRLTWTRKREGTTAWRESVEYRGGVEDAAAQGPRDMAKGGLLEAQSPAGANVTPCDTTPVVTATGIRRVRLSSSQPFRPVGDGQRACSR